jgi:3-hydroxyacyl-CoA dehydrogenase
LSKADFADCDLVMEAVFEDLDVKVAVLREVEEHISAECILATNTSSLSVTAMAESLRHPERLIGFHFFNPVAVMPLIEVVSTTHSDATAIATMIACAGNLTKSPVITKDVPGFVVNRILSVLLSEVLALVDANYPVSDAIDAARPLRLPMDPFALIDLIGRPVTLHMIESLHAFAPSRVAVSDKLVRATEGPVSSSIADDFGGMWEESFHQYTIPSLTAQIEDALTREISIMLDEGVVADVKDIDLCMLVGAGWPAAHGGISKYLDEVGSSDRVLGRRFH